MIKNLLICSIQGLNITQGLMGSVIYYPRVDYISQTKEDSIYPARLGYIQNKSSKHNHHRRCQCSLTIMVQYAPTKDHRGDLIK